MAYQSVDEIQKVLATEVFHYTDSPKKASGRALGTLVEIITFYLIRSWGLEKNTAIEKGLPEFANLDITHNVEYSLHPLLFQTDITLPTSKLPFTSKKIIKHHSLGNQHFEPQIVINSNQLLTTKMILRNACTIYEKEDFFYNAYLKSYDSQTCTCQISKLRRKPFAMFECKRVGIEEGTKKGPQTIEKAKQGAYVAKSVSSLQKIRFSNGKIGGFIELDNGQRIVKDYYELMDEIINTDNNQFLKNFILTVGVVSNHGNWFTSENHNKELKVLAQSYDWLLFLTDIGIAQFVDEILLHPEDRFKVARESFISSYTGVKGVKNTFTKVQISYNAHIALSTYFLENLPRIETWFNIITPKNKDLNDLKHEIDVLKSKNWTDILL